MQLINMIESEFFWIFKNRDHYKEELFVSNIVQKHEHYQIIYQKALTKHLFC